jgi:hypothetical protein
MGQYDERIIELAKQDQDSDTIAREVGVSRVTVWSVLDKHNLVKNRRIMVPSSYVTVDVDGKFSGQHAWMMFKALDRDKAGLTNGPSVEKKLDAFVRGLEKKTWTYNPDRGFYFVPRKASHNDRPFVEEENI